MKSVTFLKSFGGYNENESASFSDDRAQALIAGRVAVAQDLPVDQSVPAPPVPAKKTKAKADEKCESQAETVF